MQSSDENQSINSSDRLQVDEIDHDTQWERDSTLGNDDQSTKSESLRSSVYNYRYENGRTYHAYREGVYLVPNDEEEQDRLDLLHHCCKMMLEGELLSAPLIREPQRVLDVGTGTGIWAIEFADLFPTTTVIGTDLSPIQPEWVPPNLHFYIDDAETEWSSAEHERFDLVHGRALCGGIADWPRFYQHAYNSLNPGGSMEMQDHSCWVYSDDGGMDRAPGTAEWIREVDRASCILGKRLNIAHQHQQWMTDAGFEDVKQVVKKVPIGSWAKDPKLKELGALFSVQMVQSVPSFTLAYYTRVLGYPPERTQVAMATVRREFQDRSLHLYVKWYFISGRKPTV